MALDFPAPAVEGQTFTDQGATFIYRNGRWMIVGQAGSGGGGGGGDGITAVVEDPDPHLGGNLILNGHTITGMVLGVDVQPYDTVLAATTAAFTTADETKLDALPTNATLVATYAPIASPTFTGDPKAPTASPGDNDTSIATTAFVTAAVAAVGGGLDTEAVQDVVGGMVTGNTETGITVTYDDTLGKLNFVVTAVGTGDVVGPASAINNAPALFDGITGKLIKETTYPAFKTSLALTKADVGLGSVDNTADTAKPVSTAQQAALDLKAPLASPALTGAPTAPNVTALDSSTKIANTAFVTGANATQDAATASALALKANLAGGAAFTGTITVPNQTAGTNNTTAANTAFVTAAVAAGGAGTDATKVLKTGDTMSGLLQFSGTGHAGIKLITLTSAQRDALTPANGMVIYNSTTTQYEGYVTGLGWLAITVTGADIDIATAILHWTNAAGLYIATPESLGSAEVPTAGGSVTGNVALNGGTFWTILYTATGNIDFTAPSGIGPRIRYVDVLASGGARTVTASGFGIKPNIGAGIAIPSGETARFAVWNTGADNVILYQPHTPAAMRTMLNVEDGADVTDATNVATAGAVMESDYTGANVMLIASGSGNPSVVSITPSTLVGRGASGGAGTLTPAQASVVLFSALSGYVKSAAGVMSAVTDVTADVAAASLTVAGKVEIATGTETTTGSDATRAVSPDGLRSSDYGGKEIGAEICGSGTALTVGDGTSGVSIPFTMNGMDVVGVRVSAHTAGTGSGTNDFQFRRRRGNVNTDILSTKVTLGVGEYTVADGVVNAANDDLASGDLIYCDTDALTSGAPTGVSWSLVAKRP